MKIDSALKETYDSQYTGKEAHWRALGAKYKAQNVLTVTGGKKFNRVLEVGAGDGAVLQALQSSGLANEYYACEISSGAIEAIKKRNLPLLKEVVPFNGYEIPYEDSFFDLIIFTHVLEHVEHERLILREIRRTAPLHSIEVPRDYRFGVEQKVDHFLSYGHINVYTPTLLAYLLSTEGFSIEKKLLSVNAKEVSSYVFFENRNKPKTALSLLKFNLKYGIKSGLAKYLPERWAHEFISNITFLTRTVPKKEIGIGIKN